ncbi:MAG: hypothetical protein ACLQAT_09055, partial [Candidatus Binataceae bacterium]
MSKTEAINGKQGGHWNDPSPVCGELLILLENQQLSGGTMARTGLRMMPTFPSSSLRFRTAG